VLLAAAPALAGETDDPLAAEFAAAAAAAPGYPDPLERFNRGALRFNQQLDRFLIDPLTRVYTFVVPEPGRRAVRRFFANLAAPGILANDLLQFEVADAVCTTTRFAFNTVVGVGGLFDPATFIGWEGHDADFGQTLAVYGVPSGPYLVIPAFGPTTARDAAGAVVGMMFRPTTYLLGPGDQLLYGSIYGGGVGIVAREEHGDELRRLEESSVDFYAALRNAFYQTRTAQIWERQARRERTAGAEPATSVIDENEDSG
jgi:phospholipid-binding lipoprotein MlaA